MVDMSQTGLNAREQVLVELITRFVVEDQEGVDKSIQSAYEHGLEDSHLEAIRDAIREIEREKSENNTSLSELLEKSTKSSCCS